MVIDNLKRQAVTTVELAVGIFADQPDPVRVWQLPVARRPDAVAGLDRSHLDSAPRTSQHYERVVLFTTLELAVGLEGNLLVVGCDTAADPQPDCDRR